MVKKAVWGEGVFVIRSPRARAPRGLALFSWRRAGSGFCRYETAAWL